MSGPLTAGALDPSLLYLFVLGPGFGECVLIRVPPDQWIVIDSFEIADRPAAEEILDQYGGSVALVALTHPHKDHSLPAHHAMKLPHHVSTKAIDASFGAGDRDRLWIGTPYARGWGLPPKSAEGGLAKALGFVDQVHLTSLPYAHDCDDHAPCQTTRENIQKNLLPRRTDTPTDDPDVQAERLIVAGFDAKGQRVSLYHGRGTLEVSAP